MSRLATFQARQRRNARAGSFLHWLLTTFWAMATLDDKGHAAPAARSDPLSVDFAMHHRFRRLFVLLFTLPLVAWSEPAEILKFRFRGEGVTFEIATPPDPCIKIAQRGEFSASVGSVNKNTQTPTASFFIVLDNICSNDRLLSYGSMAAPALAMTVAGSGKTVVLRGTLPITTESMVTNKTSEQLIFDLVLTAQSNGLRRRHGVEHVELQDLGVRSNSTFDLREYANVTASGSIAGTIAGLPVGIGNIGHYVIQTEQDRAVQIQKY